MTSRKLALAYAICAYSGFLLVIGWSMAFLADLPSGHGIDGSAAGSGSKAAAAVDLALITLFAVHHSVMARQGPKQWITRHVPAALERSTYVLAADLLLALVLRQWRPLPAQVWDVEGTPWRALLWGLYAVGWLVAVTSTSLVDHLELVGLRQVLRAAGSEKDHDSTGLTERWFYAVVRHPLMLGLLIAFWVTPTMTVGHLLFAGAMTAYVLIGVSLEERDLRRLHGPSYAEYARRVPRLVPRPVRLPTRHRARGAQCPVKAVDGEPIGGRH